MCISYEIITFYVMASIDSTQLFIRSVMKDFIEYVSISISFKLWIQSYVLRLF